jgi:hypothetical protein
VLGPAVSIKPCTSNESYIALLCFTAVPGSVGLLTDQETLTLVGRNVESNT